MLHLHPAEAYRKYRFNTEKESKPRPFFTLCPYASARFSLDARRMENQKYNPANMEKKPAPEDFTEYERGILTVLADFAPGFCTRQTLWELLFLRGVRAARQEQESDRKPRDPLSDAMFRLVNHFMVDQYRFRMPTEDGSSYGVYRLSVHGAKLVREMGLHVSQEPMKGMNALQAYGSIQTSQLLCNLLKRLPIDRFGVDPMIRFGDGPFVRPSAAIAFGEDVICIETVRRGAKVSEWIVERMRKYEQAFAGHGLPSVILFTEDEAMSREIADILKKDPPKADILYTHDDAMVGRQYLSSIYAFDANGEKRCFAICPNAEEAEPADVEKGDHR